MREDQALVELLAYGTSRIAWSFTDCAAGSVGNIYFKVFECRNDKALFLDTKKGKENVFGSIVYV